MKVSELGEFGLIDLLAKMVAAARDNQLPSWQQLILGIGDDAAAWRGQGTTELATVDSLIQDVHFSLDGISWKELGWKAMAANLSDIAAMGGAPKYALVSLAIPEYTQVKDITDLYQGMLTLAQQHGAAIIGGDTCRAPLVMITITILGDTIENGHILTRSAAIPGDKVAVTGYLGAAAAGLEMLTGGRRFVPEAAASLRNAFLHPTPRIAEGQLLIEKGVKTAIDISDGLVGDLRQICKASQVSARIEVDRVPIHPEVKANFGEKSLELALSGGEDYELLFTASTKVITSVQRAAPCPITVIGEIVAGKTGMVTLIDSQGQPFSLRRPGWEHFIQQ